MRTVTRRTAHDPRIGLLVHRKHRTSRVILQSELHYVQGKPYRFEIRMHGSSWRFANDTAFFSIIGTGKDEEQIF